MGGVGREERGGCGQGKRGGDRYTYVRGGVREGEGGEEWGKGKRVRVRKGKACRQYWCIFGYTCTCLKLFQVEELVVHSMQIKELSIAFLVREISHCCEL